MARSDYAEHTWQALGLKNPSSSSPSRPGKYGIRIDKDGEMLYYLIFAELYAAKKFVDEVIQDEEYKWVNEYSLEAAAIVTDTGIKVACLDLEEIIDHKYTKAEEKYQLQSPYLNYAAGIRGWSKTQQREKEQEVKQKREHKAKISRDGLISIADIANDLGLEPREARAILRKKKISKPGAGWAWTKDEADGIKALLR